MPFVIVVSPNNVTECHMMMYKFHVFSFLLAHVSLIIPSLSQPLPSPLSLNSSDELASSRMGPLSMQMGGTGPYQTHRMPAMQFPYHQQHLKQPLMPFDTIGQRFPHSPPSMHSQMDHRLGVHSPIVPLAVSFSVGYLLFRLLALGVILLEKGLLKTLFSL